MKILFLSTVHPSPAAPTRGTFNRSLLRALGTLGNEVRAIVPVPWHESLDTRSGSTGDIRHPRFWFPPRVARPYLHHFLRWSVSRTATELTRDWTPDVVIGYWTHPDGTVALDLAERLGVPGVLVVGGTDINQRVHDAGRSGPIIRTLQRAHKVFTVGEPLAETVLGLGVPAGRVAVLRRGVDTTTFHRGDRAAARIELGISGSRPILLWVGRMVPVKGLDVLLEALAAIPTAERPALYLLGDGPERERLMALSGRLGLAADVHWQGPVPHARLGAWYRAADLVVLPSRSEGTPNVLLEALACGIPFVASDVGGIPAIAESADWLVPAGDVEGLTAAIRRQLEQPADVHQQSVDETGAARSFADALVETVADK